MSVELLLSTLLNAGWVEVQPCHGYQCIYVCLSVETNLSGSSYYDILTVHAFAIVRTASANEIVEVSVNHAKEK